MIKRQRDLVDPPMVLAAKGSIAATERAKVAAHYGAVLPPSKNFKFKVYSNDEVKERLGELFGFKCAYCETDYGAGMPGDVEHFRPKGGVLGPAGEFVFPGYWWLASTWENLLPSCIDCNRSRWHKVEKKKYKYGKENCFPLADAVAPASKPGAVAHEKPLLINPAEEDPSDSVRFAYKRSPAGRMESVVEPAVGGGGAIDVKGSKSIEVYGLNRPGLARSRKKAIKRLKGAIDAAQRFFELADAEADVARRARLKEEGRRTFREVAANFLHWENEYSAACLAYYRQRVHALRAKLPVR